MMKAHRGRGAYARAKGISILIAVLMGVVLRGLAQTSPATSSTSTSGQATAPQRTRGHSEPTHADVLRGAYGPYRANNDLLFYHLDIRIDPEKKFVSGKNTIRFKMLKDDTRIQLDLADALLSQPQAVGEIFLRRPARDSRLHERLRELIERRVLQNLMPARFKLLVLSKFSFERLELASPAA